MLDSKGEKSMSENYGTHGNNGGNGSLRSLVASNEEAMHKVASRLGELNAVRNGLTGFKEDLGGQLVVLFEKVETLLSNDKGIKDAVVESRKHLREGILLTNKEIVGLVSKIDEEVERRKKLEKKVEDLAQVLGKRSRWQRYYWGGIGVLMVSLVSCLGYFSYGLNNISSSLQKVETKIVIEPRVMENNVLPNLLQPPSKKNGKAKNMPKN
jgi:hypothetical protein